MTKFEKFKSWLNDNSYEQLDTIDDIEYDVITIKVDILEKIIQDIIDEEVKRLKNG